VLNMILLVVWDGLRPDMISPERTPFLARMRGEGTCCAASHCVFPTATRINAAALSTGCRPGRHGIVDNELYVPAIDPLQPFSCADARLLQRMADLEGERLVSVPTLGELLRDGGMRLLCGGSGSPGTTYLCNPTATGPVINWGTAWPAATERELARRYGLLDSKKVDTTTLNRYIWRAVREWLIPAERPDVVTLWFTEPDHAQHAHGLASPEALATLRELDADLEAFLAALGPGHTCFLLSDHGYDTVCPAPDPVAALCQAGFKDSPTSTDVVLTAASIYLNAARRAQLPALLRYLAAQPWVGALFLRDDLLPLCPTAMPQSVVGGYHRRSAEIMYSPPWSLAPNALGVPGSVYVRTGTVATHGESSPYALHNTLMAWGPRIRRGRVSEVPCAITDIAPTVLHLLGLAPQPTMEGRALRELLTDGPEPATLPARPFTREAVYETASGPRRQVAQYVEAAGRGYLEQVALL
jgi:arylsulfatase A-like enzyme